MLGGGDVIGGELVGKALARVLDGECKQSSSEGGADEGNSAGNEDGGCDREGEDGGEVEGGTEEAGAQSSSSEGEDDGAEAGAPGETEVPATVVSLQSSSYKGVLGELGELEAGLEEGDELEVTTVGPEGRVESSQSSMAITNAPKRANAYKKQGFMAGADSGCFQRMHGSLYISLPGGETSLKLGAKRGSELPIWDATIGTSVDKRVAMLA